SAERARRSQQVSIHIANAGDSIHENRKKSRKEDNEYLRPHADAEPDDDQRHHCNAWCSVERIQKRIQDQTNPPVPSDYNTESYAGDERDTESDRKILSAESKIGEEIPLGQRHPERFDDRRRPAEKQR